MDSSSVCISVCVCCESVQSFWRVSSPRHLSVSEKVFMKAALYICPVSPPPSPSPGCPAPAPPSPDSTMALPRNRPAQVPAVVGSPIGPESGPGAQQHPRPRKHLGSPGGFRSSGLSGGALGPSLVSPRPGRSPRG
jgi:hypothetical protein